MSIETTFCIAASWGYLENYAFTDEGYPDIENPRWKHKGAIVETLAYNLSLADITELHEHPDIIELFVEVRSPEDNDMYAYFAGEWSIEERSQRLIDEYVEYVRANCPEGEDYGYVRYLAEDALGVSSVTIDWLDLEAQAQGLLTVRGPRYG